MCGDCPMPLRTAASNALGSPATSPNLLVRPRVGWRRPAALWHSCGLASRDWEGALGRWLSIYTKCRGRCSRRRTSFGPTPLSGPTSTRSRCSRSSRSGRWKRSSRRSTRSLRRKFKGRLKATPEDYGQWLAFSGWDRWSLRRAPVGVEGRPMGGSPPTPTIGRDFRRAQQTIPSGMRTRERHSPHKQGLCLPCVSHTLGGVDQAEASSRRQHRGPTEQAPQQLGEVRRFARCVAPPPLCSVAREQLYFGGQA